MGEEQLYDVVVFDRATREIVSIAGSEMRLGGGFRTAESRYHTMMDRINTNNYDVDIVETGLFQKGDTYK